MSSAPSPYSTLGKEKFWKTAVADRADDLFFDAIWKPKFAIPQRKFLTAGSCFAQHISRWVIENGFHWIDSEPAPPDMAEAERQNWGYAVFSFRTGNIYTAALLKQWIFQAVGLAPIIQEEIEYQGAFYDPFRPSLPVQGFNTRSSLREARQFTLDCIKTALTEADLFVFTLGLTEGWVDVAGFCYPLCPGTIVGNFEPIRHRFHNYGFEEIRDDLIQVFDAIKAINPDMRFILTVSPVPLTATAADEHVLVATTYSKSVLRAVAALLKNTRSDVDYFPSYELISSHATRGRFYSDNLRSVTAEGVNHVMAHFSAAIRENAARREPALMHVSPTRKAQPVAPGKDPVGLVCEEILLESWRDNRFDQETIKLCLIGDCQMGSLSKVLHQRSIPHYGGQIMIAGSWSSERLHLDPDEIFVPLEGAAARARWRETLPFFAPANGDAAGKIVFTNAGMNTHAVVPIFLQWYLQKKQDGVIAENDPGFDAQSIYQFLVEVKSKELQLLQELKKRAARVVVITDPPLQHAAASHAHLDNVYSLFDYSVAAILQNNGFDVFNARAFFDRDAINTKYVQPPNEFGQQDNAHPMPEYHEHLADELIRLYF